MKPSCKCLRNFSLKRRDLPNHLKFISSASRERFLSSLILDLDLFAEPGAQSLFASYFSLTSPSFATYNFIGTLFDSRRYEVRVNLLCVVPYVVEHVGQDFINKTMITEILLGLEDENDDIYLGSLTALAKLLPILLEEIYPTVESKQSHDQKYDNLIEICISHCVRNLLSNPEFHFWGILESLRALLEAVLKVVIAKVHQNY